jgi:thioredoxin reductase
MPFTPDDPTRPAAEVVPEYFAAYEDEFDLRVRRPVRIGAVRSVGAELAVETSVGTWTTRALINATGTWTHPFVPRWPGQESFRGRQLHTADYRGPGEFAGKRVVVVGGGTSAVQLLLEIAPVAAATTWVTRRPPVWHDGPFDAEAGRAAVAPEVQAGIAAGVLQRHPLPERFTPTGVMWADGTSVEADIVLWCTGFRAALGHLAPLHLRTPSGGIVMDGTRVVADPRIHLVGYGPSASTIGANRAGKAAAREVVALLERARAA